MDPDQSRDAEEKSTGSDHVKSELVLAHPDTRAADWKRRTRTKEVDGIHRRFEHADGRSVETIERPDGAVTILPATNTPSSTTAAVTMEWPDAEHSGIEIFVSGPRVDELTPGFEEFGDNPDVAALFRHAELHDEDGDYNGDGCDRLEMRKGVLWAAIDGTSAGYVARILEDCRICADRNPDLSYMVVGSHPVGEDELQRYDVLFLKGFDATSNPMRREHGRFYADYVVRGI